MSKGALGGSFTGSPKGSSGSGTVDLVTQTEIDVTSVSQGSYNHSDSIPAGTSIDEVLSKMLSNANPSFPNLATAKALVPVSARRKGLVVNIETTLPDGRETVVKWAWKTGTADADLVPDESIYLEIDDITANEQTRSLDAQQARLSYALLTCNFSFVLTGITNLHNEDVVVMDITRTVNSAGTITLPNNYAVWGGSEILNGVHTITLPALNTGAGYTEGVIRLVFTKKTVNGTSYVLVSKIPGEQFV